MIILASESPRRRELLARIGLTDFTVIPSGADETLSGEQAPEDAVCALARRKALSVSSESGPGDIIIAADTIVVLDGLRLGKPADEADAERMLKTLSGRRHQVFTGVALMKDDTVLCEFEETWVFFRHLTDEEIRLYAASGEPRDKAGAYGIQQLGATLIDSIEGDFYNVMGLPLCLLAGMLRQVGLDVLQLTVND